MDDTRRVFLVDDERPVLTALGRLLRVHGYATEAFDSPRAFLARTPHDGPACVVLDLSMPEMTGLEVQHSMRMAGDETATIFLSGASDVPQTAQAMREGAHDFLVKPVDEAELIAAVSQALESDRTRREFRAQQQQAQERIGRLTPREREVCELVGRGLLNKQIGYELHLAEKTVKIHRGRAMRKLAVDSVPALVRLLSLLEPPSGIPRVRPR